MLQQKKKRGGGEGAGTAESKMAKRWQLLNLNKKCAWLTLFSLVLCLFSIFHKNV